MKVNGNYKKKDLLRRKLQEMILYFTFQDLVDNIITIVKLNNENYKNIIEVISDVVFILEN